MHAVAGLPNDWLANRGIGCWNKLLTRSAESESPDMVIEFLTKRLGRRESILRFVFNRAADDLLHPRRHLRGDLSRLRILGEVKDQQGIVLRISAREQL